MKWAFKPPYSPHWAWGPAPQPLLQSSLTAYHKPASAAFSTWCCMPTSCLPWFAGQHHVCLVLQANRSNITRARTLYELALEADPHHLQSLLGLGSLEARSGNVDRGLKLLHDGLRLQPGNKQIRHGIAQWQRKHGEREVSFRCSGSACIGFEQSTLWTGRSWHQVDLACTCLEVKEV